MLICMSNDAQQPTEFKSIEIFRKKSNPGCFWRIFAKNGWIFRILKHWCIHVDMHVKRCATTNWIRINQNIQKKIKSCLFLANFSKNGWIFRILKYWWMQVDMHVKRCAATITFQISWNISKKFKSWLFLPNFSKNWVIQKIWFMCPYLNNIYPNFSNLSLMLFWFLSFL